MFNLSENMPHKTSVKIDSDISIQINFNSINNSLLFKIP